MRVDQGNEPATPAGTEDQAVLDVAGLWETLEREDSVVDRIAQCLKDLRDVQAAKATLAALPARQLRAGIEYRSRRRAGANLPAPQSAAS